jgi:hypothetical protein
VCAHQTVKVGRIRHRAVTESEIEAANGMNGAQPLNQYFIHEFFGGKGGNRFEIRRINALNTRLAEKRKTFVPFGQTGCARLVRTVSAISERKDSKDGALFGGVLACFVKQGEVTDMDSVKKTECHASAFFAGIGLA